MGPSIADSREDGTKNQVIADFNPTAIGNRSYGIGNYYGLFPYDVISVSAPLQGTTILMDTCWFTVRCPDWCQSRTGF